MVLIHTHVHVQYIKPFGQLSELTPLSNYAQGKVDNDTPIHKPQKSLLNGFLCGTCSNLFYPNGMLRRG